MAEMEAKTNDFMTDCTIASIRHTLDTTDTFYEKEDEYINNTYPTIMPQMLAVDDALMNSKFRGDIEKEYGRQYFAQKELQKKTFCEANIPLMQQESKLTNEYQKIMATAEIPFDGKTLNLYGVQKYFEHEDRQMRKAAVKAYSDFYHQHEERLEQIWDELIKIRNQMGKNLGYDNFIPVGYMQQGRTDYGQKEVESFREQVRTVLVPLCENYMRHRQSALASMILPFMMRNGCSRTETQFRRAMTTLWWSRHAKCTMRSARRLASSSIL